MMIRGFHLVALLYACVLAASDLPPEQEVQEINLPEIVPPPPLCDPCRMPPGYTCPQLPEDCQVGFATCGCCPECRGKVGDRCDAMSVDCESELVCRDPDTWEALETVTWEHWQFRGMCAEPVRLQVVDPGPPVCMCPAQELHLDPDTGEVTELNPCPVLPEEGCEHGFAFCGCCRSCRHKVGESCDFFAVSCETGLVCRNAAGEELQEITWKDHEFTGECARPARRKRADVLLQRLTNSQ